MQQCGIDGGRLTERDVVCSGKLQADRERGCIAVGRGRRSQHELIAAATEDAIILIPRVAPALCGIGLIGMDAIRESIVEVHLRRELIASLSLGFGANLDMNVHRSALIPAWVDGDESSLALRIGDLISAQKFLAERLEGRRSEE